MGKISKEHESRMRGRFDPKVARFIADEIGSKATVTYGDLQTRFGILARSWGDPLGGITYWCRDRGLPLLPVVVVLKKTGMPSKGAALYEDLGLKSEEQIIAEQQRCRAYDWSSVDFT